MVLLRACIMTGWKLAESLLAEREKKRENGAGVSRNAELKQADTSVLRCYRLLCCYAAFLLDACAAACRCHIKYVPR